MRPRSIRTATLVIPALLLSLTGCGSDDDAATADAATGATTDAPAVDTTTVESTAATTGPPASSAPTTEEPTTTEAATVAELDAVELLSSMNLVGTDYGPDYTIAVDVADLSTPNAVAAEEAAAATPECGPPTVEAPLPYSTMTSGARIDFVNSIGGTASAQLVVMPMEAASIGYLEALRSDETIPTCVGLATLRDVDRRPSRHRPRHGELPVRRSGAGLWRGPGRHGK